MRDLPTGTVTFLFTDVEGSTRLLKELRGRYAAVLEEHRRLLREVFARHGGHEIDTQGDSFFVAFRRARDGVAAAVDAQRALHQHEWEGGASVRVRMGLHTGEAEPEDERYVGLAVHRGARIAAAAHGGQVLVSQITHDLLHDEEAELAGVAIRDLGEHPLKDMDRPVRLYQVVAAGLPADFPPPRTAVEPAGAQPAAPGAGRRRRRVAAAAAVAAVAAALAAAVALGALRDGSEAIPPIAVGSLVEVDPSTGEVLDVFSVGGGGYGKVVATSEAVWVLDADRRVLARVLPESGDVQRVGMDAVGIAPAREGRLWVAARQPARILLVAPDDLRVLRTIDLRASSVEDLASGGGQLWAVIPDSPDEGAPGDVVRVHVRSGEIRARRPAGQTPWVIAQGFDAVWILNYEGDTVTRLGSDDRVSRIAVRSGPLAVAVGAGAVWVAHYWEPTVAKLVPGADEVEDYVRLRTPALGLAADDSSVWATQPCQNRLAKIDPEGGDVARYVPLAASPIALGLGAGALWVAIGPRPEEC